MKQERAGMIGGEGQVDAGLTTTNPRPFMSFILRCWEHAPGELRGRLVDTHSGRQYPLKDLREVPDLIQHILRETGESFTD